MLASYVSLALLVMAYSPGAVNAQRLYRDSDPVVQLDGSNFDSHVLNSSAAWVVEFYAAWCGHCQRFVPTWVAFSRDIQGQWYNIRYIITNFKLVVLYEAKLHFIPRLFNPYPAELIYLNFHTLEVGFRYFKWLIITHICLI